MLTTVPPSPTAPADLLHSAFYRFVPLADPAAAAAALRRLAGGLTGSVIVAAEGLSGAVAGPPDAVQAFERALTDGVWGCAPPGALRSTDFKRSACTTPPFGRLKVSVRPEIVALGLPAQAPQPGRDIEPGADCLAPARWRDLLAGGSAVVLDNRNHFEYRLGHFRGALDPGVRNFRDFVDRVREHAPAWQAAGRPVAMYCTGGVRCEKTAPWLRSLGLAVWQLDGGILNYFRQVPDAARDWVGECFVFDNRIALDCALHETPTTAQQVYDPSLADEAWRLARAARLDAATAERTA
jgi:UPF0176 protein